MVSFRLYTGEIMNNNDEKNLPSFDEEVNSKPQEALVVQNLNTTNTALEAFEQRESLFKKVLAAAISSTSPKDWVDQDGKPYLQASGAERVSMRFGVQIFGVTQERQNFSDAKGDYYIFVTKGSASFGQASAIETMGTCSSRDKFFGRAKGQLRAVEDVDMANIMKKSYTNFTVNAITRLLGIRALTWDELAQYGIRREGAGTVSYRKPPSSSSSLPRQQENPAPQQDKSPQQDKQKKPYWQSEWKGKSYINAYQGRHFTDVFLIQAGFKRGNKEGVWYTEFDINKMLELDVEFVKAEKFLNDEGGV